MLQFQYVVSNSYGISARAANQIAKVASKCNSRIIMKKDEKEADANRIFQILKLRVKHSDTIMVIVTGEDEETTVERLKGIFQQYILV